MKGESGRWVVLRLALWGKICVWSSHNGGGEVIYACAASRGPGRKISEMQEGALKRYSYVGLEYSLFDSVMVLMHDCSMSLTILHLGVQMSTTYVFVVECGNAAQSLAFI